MEYEIIGEGKSRRFLKMKKMLLKKSIVFFVYEIGMDMF
jgi:hypothetical protein